MDTLLPAAAAGAAGALRQAAARAGAVLLLAGVSGRRGFAGTAISRRRHARS
jgi:hypothetical protein